MLMTFHISNQIREPYGLRKAVGTRFSPPILALSTVEVKNKGVVWYTFLNFFKICGLLSQFPTTRRPFFPPRGGANHKSIHPPADVDAHEPRYNIYSENPRRRRRVETEAGDARRAGRRSSRAGLGRGFALPGTSASLTLALRRSGNLFLPDSSRPLRRTMRFPASFVGVFSTIGAPQTHSFDRAKRESRGAPGGSGTSVKEIWNRTIIGVFLKKVGEKEKIFWENT